VRYDIAEDLINEQPLSISTLCFNCMWQGSANEIAISGLLHTGNPAVKMNVTGPECVSVKYATEKLAKLLGKIPIYTGEEQNDAYLNNAGKAIELFGYPSVSIETLLQWQAEWLIDGGRGLGKPTHFEERKGSY
jgi:hypothetical protein